MCSKKHSGKFNYFSTKKTRITESHSIIQEKNKNAVRENNALIK